MKQIILPEIVAIGRYNAALVHKGRETTKNRKTTMFEIELPTADGGISYVDGESALIRKDTVILAKPGQLRHTRLPFECLYVHMTLDGGALYERLLCLPSFIPLKSRAEAERILLALCDAYERALEVDMLLIQSHILALVHLLSEHTAAATFHGTQSNKETVDDTIRYIRENLTADLSLATLAARAAFSPIHFHNCFKRSTGRTLRAFVEEERLRGAINLLVSTDLTLSEIAYRTGFSSQSYFSSAFKRKMKMTPREYAKTLRQRYGE